MAVYRDSSVQPIFRSPISLANPSLDGLRAFSIVLVLIAHVSLQYPWLRRFVEHVGNYGVRIFFVISGFLITGLLLKELTKTGRISLKSFYIRRTLRIFPAFYVYVLTVVILAWAGILILLPGDLLHAVTYTMNYHMVRSWWLNHMWSLSVEEQFYLLWPTVLRHLWSAARFESCSRHDHCGAALSSHPVLLLRRKRDGPGTPL